MQVTRRRWQVKTMNLFVRRQGTIVQLLIHCASNFGPPVRKPWGSFLLQKYLHHFEMLSATLKDSLGFLKSKLRSISFNLYTSRSFTLWWLDMFVDIIFCCWIWLSLLCSLHFSVLSVCVREHICILFVPREGSGLIPSGTPPQTAHHWRDNPLPCTLHTTYNTL